MNRGIQPFSTQEDGDTLFAASAQEVEYRDPGGVTMGAIASEIMWDTILASVQEQRPFVPSAMPPNPGLAAVCGCGCSARTWQYRSTLWLREPNKAILQIRR